MTALERPILMQVVDDAELAAMLKPARELHQSLHDQDDETRAQVLAAVRGRLKSQADAPDAPAEYLLLAAEIIDLLDNPRLKAPQARDLERASLATSRQVGEPCAIMA